jgi:glutaredoxin 3
MPKITIYSTTTCSFCKMLKGYLKQHNISYVEKLADEDMSVAQELFEKSNQLGVPFTIIEQDDKEAVSILGFDRRKFDQVLGL